MKKLLLGLIFCLLALCNTGCSTIDGILDDYLNYSTVTIEYDYEWIKMSNSNENLTDYKNLKVVFGENEYNAVGSYRVPKGTVINLSWSYYYRYWASSQYKWKWADASENVSVGTNAKTTIVIAGSDVSVTTHE